MSDFEGGQYVALNTEVPPDRCARAYLLSQVDALINEGAISEAADANSELQDPDVLRDVEESPYLTPGVTFEKTQAECGLCNVQVMIGSSGSVYADGCAASGFCEWQIAARLGRDGYSPADELPNEQPAHCSGVGCPAQVALWRTVIGENMTPEVVQGRCAVDSLGVGWIARMGVTITKEPLDAPDPDRMQTNDYEDANAPQYQGEIGTD